MKITLTWLKNNFYEYLIYLIIFIFFILGSQYVSYPDEFVNLLGSKSILNNQIPYKNFFDHHLPFAWYFGAFLLKFSFNSYPLFRLSWSLFAFFILFLLSLYIKRNIKKLYFSYLIFFIFYPLTSLYLWFHLYLADSLAVLFFSLVFWLTLIQTFSKKRDSRMIFLNSFLIFCLIFSSMTFVYLGIILYLWNASLIKNEFKEIIKFIILLLTPYFLYLIYLLLTDSWQDFYFSNITYNTRLYISIPNYVKGSHFNPLKFGLTLIDNFWSNYLVLLTFIKHLDLYLPIGVLVGLGSLSLMLYLLIKKPIFGVLYFFLLSFSAPRSNVQKISETDYQVSLFVVLGLISSLVIFSFLKEESWKTQLIEDVKRITLILLTVYLFFSFLFLGQNWYHKIFSIYTQKMPRIYNFSYVSDFIDSLIDDNDYYWVGPYEPHHEFFVKKGKLPGKYPTLLPQFREDDYLKSSFLNQFELNRPKIIIFNHQASIFMTPADEFGRFFLDWLKKNRYQNLDQLGLKSVRSPSEFNIQTDLYLDLDYKENLIEKLKDNKYLF